MRSVRGFLVALLIVIPTLVWAQSSTGLSGLISRIDANGVTVSVGRDQSVTVGQEFYVYRAEAMVGKVRIVQVDQSSALAVVTNTADNQSIQQGDVVESSPRQAVSPQPPPQPQTYTPPPITGDPTRAYENILKHRTQSYLFKVGPAAKIHYQVPVWEAVNLLTTTSLYTGIPGAGNTISPWIVGDMAYSYYATEQVAKRSRQISHSQIDIIYWDEPLVSAYTDYYCFKDAPGDPARQAQIRQSINAQRGIDTVYAFQVRITNRGPIPLQIAPFNWHIYMVDRLGNRIKASSYDAALDKGLNEQQQAIGYVYFPRADVNGNPLLNPGDPIKLQLEDILGDHATVTWKL